MNVEYLVGGKEVFLSFLDSIGFYDKVAILTHNDLDGVASGIFLSKILEARGIKLDCIKFLEIKNDMVKEVSVELKEKGITKIFFTDLNVESIDPEGFEDLRRDKDVFLIDHHPIEKELKDTSNIIKTISEDCASLAVFVLGEGLIDYPSWGWLVCATIFADYSFRIEKNFKFVQSFYPEAKLESLSSSVPGLNARRISSALIYYKNDINHVYELLKERNLEEFSELHGLIEEEVYKIVDDFSENKEYFPKKDIYFYEIKSRFEILSYVATLIAGADREKNFLFMYRGKDLVKFSARSSKAKINMGNLMKEGVQGLEGADGGGHIEAAAAKVIPQDVETFLRRVLE